MPAPAFTHALQAHGLKHVFIDHHAFVSTLMTALVDMYGTEAFKWSPATLVMELQSDLGVTLPSVLLDRIMAGIILLTTDRFYKSQYDFIELCNILSGSAATPGVFSPAEADDIAWGITEALLLAPPDEHDEAPFTEEIRGYIGHVLQQEGILTPPDILKIAVIDPKALSRVQADFADDPVMSEAVWQMQASKTEDINTLVRERLMRLVSQLQELRLENGQTAEIASRMLSNLQSRPKGGSPLS